MAPFASRWPDMRIWAIDRLIAGASALPSQPERISAERDETLGSQIVVSVVPAQMATVVSRTFMVSIEVWDPDKLTAFDVCQEAAYQLESAPRRRPVVSAELNAGPNEHRDEAGNYSYGATVMVTASRLPNN